MTGARGTEPGRSERLLRCSRRRWWNRAADPTSADLHPPRGQGHGLRAAGATSRVKMGKGRGVGDPGSPLGGQEVGEQLPWWFRDLQELDWVSELGGGSEGAREALGSPRPEGKGQSRGS